MLPIKVSSPAVTRISFFLGAVLASSFVRAERILLIPLDGRPATGQFAQMIGRISGVDIQMPPKDLLGRFTQPGDSDAILDWLAKQDFQDVLAVVASTDMIGYGGLIASRTLETSKAKAVARLNRFAQIRKVAKATKFYGMSATMRLTPTATKSAAAWRLPLGRFAEIKERYRQTKDPKYLQSLKNLLAKIPSEELLKYDQIRARNHEIQGFLIRQTAAGLFDYLICGQDDAQPYGPHIPETAALRNVAVSSQVSGKVYFAEGVDQLANVLISRALLRARSWVPRIRLNFSDDLGKLMVADYESKTIERSLSDQLLASGSRPANTNEYDFALFLNTPQRREEPFLSFLQSLTSEVDQGFPVAVADINLAKNGTSDPELFDAMNQENRMIRLLSYAGWNTAGNTMGTVIPAANVYLLARRGGSDPLQRELARREFILHRFVNDYCYHKFVRPLAYQLIDSTPNASREETYGPAFDAVNELVQTKLREYLESTFQSQFLGQRFFAGNKQYEIDALQNIKIFLPWPRAYEVQMEFSLSASEVTD
ncbi:MAG: DUF4127 family protein [Fimbriimonadaceae bacterium]